VTHDVPIADRPVPVPAGARLVLYFGGTFDPPHQAHVALPAAARDATGADHLLYVPTGQNPLKGASPRATDRQRLDMLALALRGADRASIWTRELSLDDRAPTGPDPTPSFTIDTIRALRDELPSACAVRLLIGADQAAQFHRWRDADRLLVLADPLVMLRPPDETPDDLAERLRDHWPAPELDRWRARCLPIPTIDLASTGLRAALADPARTRNAPLPEAVGRYIAENGLYRSG
jgi:nicotinate-nucleotide adenylyltransferase